MLKSLTVTNFALIEQATVEFDEGLNILTGETGAGKSILIDALSAILGNRASVDSIRTGCDFFRVEAVFDITLLVPIHTILEEQGIVVDEDTIIISRRFSRLGKNTIMLNGCHITLSVLRQIGEKLVDIHGQHENQALLRPEAYLAMLDALDNRTRGVLEEYGEIYTNWLTVMKELSVLEKNSRERAQRIDMLNWQTKEIAAAELKLGEDEELEQQILVLANSEKIAKAVNRAYMLLEQDGDGVLSIVAEAKHELEIAVRYDPKLEGQLTGVSNALYQLEESCMDLRVYGDEIEFNPQYLNQLQARVDVIYKLKKKYGTTIDEILAYYNQAIIELDDINNYDQKLIKLNKQQHDLEETLSNLADQLDGLRKNASHGLAKQVCEHLADLGMIHATFLIEVLPTSQFTPTGRNEVMFLFSANPGEEPKLLHKIASGGELSRIALAIKTVCATRDAVGIMVFDEIDAGIGGQAGHMVAEKVVTVACTRQVLCITHLPQIACMADRHIYIKKQVDGERTHTILTVLSKQEQLIELTRMISGDHITQIAVDNATQMFESAYEKKEKLRNKIQK